MGGPETTTETVFGVTSLTRDEADAPRLLKLVRRHWSVEALFHVRASTGSAPVVLSALRNAAITLLDQSGATNKAAALRRHAAHPEEALALVKGGSG